MPDTGLDVTYQELQAQVCNFMHGTDDPSVISDLEQRNLARIIKNGLRRFYYPAQVDPALMHDWSFLVTAFDIPIESNKSDYLMPFNFGGAIGPLHHDPTDNIRVSVQKVTVNKILWSRQLNVTLSMWPMYYAEQPIHQGGLNGTRWKLLFWPTPSANFDLHGTQKIHPLASNSVQNVVYGGTEHGQTILEACLAQAELYRDQTAGIHAVEFLNCLRTSIMLDQTQHIPDSLGYNGENKFRGTNPLMRDDRHFENFSPVTVGNINYGG